jgi:hypothetical protein
MARCRTLLPRQPVPSLSALRVRAAGQQACRGHVRRANRVDGRASEPRVLAERPVDPALLTLFETLGPRQLSLGGSVLSSQLVTIVAVLAGAACTYLVSRLTEKSKFERELQIRWDQRRLDAYIAFISAAKLTGAHATKLHALQRRNAAATDLDDALAALKAHETRRSEVFEGLVLLADASTIEAAHSLNRAVWALESPVRLGERISDEEIRTRADAFVTAMNNLHVAARSDLRIPGQFARRDVAALLIDEPVRGVAPVANDDQQTRDALKRLGENLG